MGAAPSHELPPQNPLRRSALGPRPTNSVVSAPPLNFANSHHQPPTNLRPIEYRPPVQQSEIVRNVVWMTKSSLRLEQVPSSNQYLVSFRFNADVPGYITVYYRAREVMKRAGRGNDADVVHVGYVGKSSTVPGKTRFDKGRGQLYRQKQGKGADIETWNEDDRKWKEGSRWPIVIRIEADYPDSWAVEDRLRVRSQTTFADIVNHDNQFLIRIVRQEVLVGATVHRVMDLYGIGGGEVQAEKTEGDGKWKVGATHECVICLTEPCNTAVLPCHHFCLCDDCARILSAETDPTRRKCPVCRGTLGGFLRIIGVGEGTEEVSQELSQQGSTTAEERVNSDDDEEEEIYTDRNAREQARQHKSAQQHQTSAMAGSSSIANNENTVGNTSEVTGDR